MGNRIAAAQQKINLIGSNQSRATTLFSLCKYPAESQVFFFLFAFVSHYRRKTLFEWQRWKLFLVKVSILLVYCSNRIEQRYSFSTNVLPVTYKTCGSNWFAYWQFFVLLFWFTKFSFNSERNRNQQIRLEFLSIWAKWEPCKVFFNMLVFFLKWRELHSLMSLWRKYEIKYVYLPASLIKEAYPISNRKYLLGEQSVSSQQAGPMQGLGRLPAFLPSVTSCLLFNSDENPYKTYNSFNNLEVFFS